MSLRFNPFTGTFDYIGQSTSSSTIVFAQKEKTVDAAFITDKKITLSSPPINSSEFIFLNGLLLGKDCYNIVGNEITFGATLPFKVGHFIDIRYAV